MGEVYLTCFLLVKNKCFIRTSIFTRRNIRYLFAQVLQLVKNKCFIRTNTTPHTQHTQIRCIWCVVHDHPGVVHVVLASFGVHPTCRLRLSSANSCGALLCVIMLSRHFVPHSHKKARTTLFTRSHTFSEVRSLRSFTPLTSHFVHAFLRSRTYTYTFVHHTLIMHIHVFGSFSPTTTPCRRFAPRNTTLRLCVHWCVFTTFIHTFISRSQKLTQRSQPFTQRLHHISTSITLSHLL